MADHVTVSPGAAAVPVTAAAPGTAPSPGTAAAAATPGHWFRRQGDPAAPLRLFLFPHAGSGGLIYRTWPPLLPDDLEIQIVQLPGRESRLKEESYREFAPLADALYEALVNELDERPFAFFGHCLGAQLAYRMTHELERDGLRGPELLGASSWTPVGFAVNTIEQARMPEPELIQWMKNLGSFPEDTYDDPELLAMIIPALRADIEVSATYVDDGAAVSSPIVGFCGQSDPLMPAAAMGVWAKRTPEFLGNSSFSGGHFYIDNADHRMTVIASYLRHLNRQLARRAAH